MLKTKKRVMTYTMLIFALVSLVSMSFAQNNPKAGMKRKVRKLTLLMGNGAKLLQKQKKVINIFLWMLIQLGARLVNY